MNPHYYQMNRYISYSHPIYVSRSYTTLLLENSYNSGFPFSSLILTISSVNNLLAVSGYARTAVGSSLPLWKIIHFIPLRDQLLNLEFSSILPKLLANLHCRWYGPPLVRTYRIQFKPLNCRAMWLSSFQLFKTKELKERYDTLVIYWWSSACF